MRKQRILKTLALMFTAFVALSIFNGCTGRQQQPGDSGVSGNILVVGSTALQPLAEQASSQFKAKYPNANVQVQGGGSGTGLTAVSQGSAQIGMSDIFAEEKSGIDPKALTDYKVAVAGFAVIANPGIGVENLTKKQLVDIFTGRVTNWREVGGNDVGVVLINRPASSGTRSTFKKYGLGGAEEASGKALTQDSSGAVLKTVGDTQGAVSYIGLSYISNNKTVKALKIDEVEPMAENIANGKYGIWSYEHMYTRGEAQGVVKAFIDYIMSDEAKTIALKLGYIPISDMKVSR